MAAVLAEGVVAAAELAGHLLVGGAAARHQHDVEPREAADGEEHEGDDAHDDHGDDGRHLRQVVLVVEDVDEAEDEDADHVEGE